MYYFLNIVRLIIYRKVRWNEYIPHTGEIKKLYKIFIGQSEGKRPLEISTYRWKESIKMNIKQGVRV
jgi:hypothetical protein